MMLKRFFDISTGFRFSKISVEGSVHLCSCPWLTLPEPGQQIIPTTLLCSPSPEFSDLLTALQYELVGKVTQKRNASADNLSILTSKRQLQGQTRSFTVQWGIQYVRLQGRVVEKEFINTVEWLQECPSFWSIKWVCGKTRLKD